MSKIYLLKKLDPSHPIWSGRKDSNAVRFSAESEEQARERAASYHLVPGRRFAPSPWKDSTHYVMLN